MSAAVERPGKVWRKAPSPCVSVCKFRDEGRCLGCQMTKREKKGFKRLRAKAEKKAFFRELMGRLDRAGRLAYWTRMYRRRCDKKGRPCPLDRLEKRKHAA